MDQKKRDREQKQQGKERDQAERKRKCAEKLQQALKSKYKCTSEHVRESDDSQSDDSQSDDEYFPVNSKPETILEDTTSITIS